MLTEELTGLVTVYDEPINAKTSENPVRFHVPLKIKDNIKIKP
jgi:hypothetical protein